MIRPKTPPTTILTPRRSARLLAKKLKDNQGSVNKDPSNVNTFIHTCTVHPSIDSFIYLSIGHSSIHLSIHPSIHDPSIPSSIYLSICSSIYSSFYSSIYPYIHLFFHLFIHLSYPFIHLFLHLFIHPSTVHSTCMSTTNLSNCLFIYLSIHLISFILHLFIHPYIHISMFIEETKRVLQF